MDEKIPDDEKAIGVVITNTKADGMLTYDAVRRAWSLSEAQLAKANEARYVLAIEYGTVVDIFEKHGKFRPDTGEPDRYTFTPVPVADALIRRQYIGKKYRSYGASVVFFGFDNNQSII